MLFQGKKKEDENIKILVNNIKILYYHKSHNYENSKAMIIYDYLKNLNIEYDNEHLLSKMKEYNYELYKKYLNILQIIYNNLHNESRNSIFDDYEGHNTWNEKTFFYRNIYSILEKSPNNLHQTRFK